LVAPVKPAVPLLLFALFGALPALSGLTPLEEGRAAEAAENYQKALELYRKALAESPDDPAPARALADLFTGKGLHDLALPQWQEVVRRSPGDATAWLGLSQTLSYLDDNKQSVKTLSEAQTRFPEDAEVVQALAWMLFKTEDFPRGIALVEVWTKAHGADRNLEMTLGTLYSSVFDYDLSRIHYLKSIDLARGRGSAEKNFRSIAWYNLSLLEKAFYQFDLADEAIRKSIEEEDRSAGALAWGELYQGRRDFSEARRLYEKAVQADETPLGRFDLAGLLQQFGLLDEAEAQLVQVERHKDDTWIYNYGVTKDKVKRDLAELRSALHRSRFRALDFAARTTLWDWVTWSVAKVREGLLWWYHDQTWKSLLVRLSESSLAASNSPDAWVGLTLAHRQRPALALKYLGLVRAHELPRNPRSLGSYLVEEGVIRRDASVLESALGRLQTPWENEDRERAVATLIEVRRSEGKTVEVRKLLADLYRLNAGGLPGLGWGLPVRFAVYGDEAQRQDWRKSLEDYAGQTGWDASAADRPAVAWTLDLRTEATGATWTLRDPEGLVARTGVVRSGPDGRLSAAAQIFRAIHSPK
jgi:tetratricopeptide (TPR) repeat protein